MGKCIFLSKPNESFPGSVNKKLKLVYILLFYIFQALSNLGPNSPIAR